MLELYLQSEVTVQKVYSLDHDDEKYKVFELTEVV